MNHVKIGILGGTFNPIHNGHMAMVNTARMQYDLDYVLLIPAGIPYKKTNVIDSKKRLEMVMLAVEDEEYLKVSDMEIRREGNTYTIDTIRILKEEYSHAKFYFIIGEDSLYHIETWKESHLLLNEVALLVAHRKYTDVTTLKDFKEQIKYLESAYNAKIQLLDMPELDISSTDVRERIKNHSKVDDCLNPKVLDYIMEHQLYH